MFKISTNGGLTTLYSFTGGNDGGLPNGPLVQGRDGSFYGTTQRGGGYPNHSPYGSGTVFKISTNGVLTTLYSFTGGNDGAQPHAGLVQGSDGYFYGTTESGGAFPGADPYGDGTVFRISTNGTLTTLRSFTGGPYAGNHDGAYPYGGLLQGSDGDFYGTTYAGGTGHNGTVFKISTNGTFIILYSFTGGNDGNGPIAGLVQGSDGSFYGTTPYGGQGGAGTVFRLSVGLAPPAIQAVTLTNGWVTLTWSAEAGDNYQVEYSSNLKPGNWTSLGSPVTATGATLSATDPITGGQKRFYRVVLIGFGG